MQAVYMARPFKDRAPVLEHVQPASLAFTVALCGATLGATVASAPELPEIPKSATGIAGWIFEQLRFPVAREIAITSTQRYLEHVVVDKLLADKPQRASKYVRSE